MITTQQRKPSTKQMQQVERYLLFHTPGYQWFAANQHRFEALPSMNAMQSLTIVVKAFRYIHLNMIVNGNWATDEAKQERRNLWIAEIRTQARIISLKTNVPFEKVFSLLYRRMIWELEK